MPREPFDAPEDLPKQALGQVALDSTGHAAGAPGTISGIIGIAATVGVCENESWQVERVP